MPDPYEFLPRPPPKPAIHRPLADVEEEWNRQAEAFTREERPGVLHLLREKTHRLAGDDFRPGYFKRFRLKVRSEGPPRL